MLDFNLFAKQISKLSEENALSSPKVIVLTILFIWLFKFLKGNNDNITNYRDNELKNTMNCCAEILKNAELALSNKISRAEFFGIVNDQLPLMRPETFNLFVKLLNENGRSIKEFKSTALKELTSIKTKKHISGKYFSKVVRFFDSIFLIAIPFVQTTIVILIIFLTIHTIVKENNLFLFLSLSIYIFTEILLLTILLDYSAKFLNLIINILIFSLPILLYSFTNLSPLTFVAFVLCTVINIVVQIKMYKLTT
ncbi:hypothetical protein RE735_06965 [Bacillus aerius]|uniref:hypothetical protein n=1 Tax=Bacillus aerius TaxID=293388 RepID=UPI0028160A66|nr:hypothetical protein [Bacillus aerius]WMT30264.1 hypothetical protein RE735_06965 [Bacillus aerius]